RQEYDISQRLYQALLRIAEKLEHEDRLCQEMGYRVTRDCEVWVVYPRRPPSGSFMRVSPFVSKIRTRSNCCQLSQYRWPRSFVTTDLTVRTQIAVKPGTRAGRVDRLSTIRSRRRHR